MKIENQNTEFKNIMTHCTNAGLPEPFYKDMGADYALIFEKEKGNCSFDYNDEKIKDLDRDLEKDPIKLLSKNEKKIFELVKNNLKITSRELSEIININERNIRKNMDKLKSKGLIKHIGPDKGGYWKIINQGNEQ